MESFKSNTISEVEDEEKESSVHNEASGRHQHKHHQEVDAFSSSVADNKKSYGSSKRIMTKTSSSIWSICKLNQIYAFFNQLK